MNLSNSTVAILKNFAEINKNILVKPGKQLKTISTLKNILAEADIDNKFEQEFAIYDLPEFLRAVNYFLNQISNLMVLTNWLFQTPIQDNQLSISLQISQ